MILQLQANNDKDSNSIEIAIYLHDESKISLEVDLSWTVKSLKNRIVEKLNLPKGKKISLHRYGEYLNDKRTLDSYDIATTPFVCLKGPAHVINPGERLTLENVKKKAAEEFSNHPDKVEILEKLGDKLTSIHYEKSLQRNKAPWGNKDGYSSGYYFFAASSKEKQISKTVSNFVDSLPGVDTAPYKGQVLK